MSRCLLNSIREKFASKRIGDQAFVVADNSLALKLLNWYPKRNLENMCKDHIKFYF